MLGMAYIRVLEIATFYTMFQLAPVGTTAHVQVCGTTPCMLRGAERLIKDVCQRAHRPSRATCRADGDFSWEEVECLGACVNAPMVQISKDYLRGPDAGELREAARRPRRRQRRRSPARRSAGSSRRRWRADTLTDAALTARASSAIKASAPPGSRAPGKSRSESD